MSAGQDIIVCEVCESEPLQHFCKQHEVGLCNNCIHTHMNSSESIEGHTIVKYKYKDAKNVAPKQCSTHLTEKKTLFCKQCDVQMCTKGLIEHRGHEIVDLKQFVELKYKDIDKNTSFLRTTVRPDFECGIEKLKQVYEEASSRFDKERQTMIDAEKYLLDKVTRAMKALLDEMESRQNETLTRITDLKNNIETKLQTIDEFIDRCEAAKTSLEGILSFKFDETLLDMEYSVKVEIPQYMYISPRKWTVDVGKFQSITESRRISKIDEENNVQLPASGRVLPEKDNTEPAKPVINITSPQTESTEGTDKPDGETKEEVLSLFELLNKETNKESDEYEEAYQDLVHMFTCQAVLRSSFPQAVN